MKIGIGLPTQIRDMDAAIIPPWASRAEEAGFSTLASIGRIAYPGVMDTVALAGAAAATSRIGLSSNVMLATVWPAALLAKELAGIDAMSRGRLIVGLGIGGDRPDDFLADGHPPRHLGRRMDSDLETYHHLWRSEPVGGGVNAAVPTGTRPIPLLFGGMAPRSFQRMATWGEGYVAGSLPAPAIEPMFEAARRAWRDAGRRSSPRLVAIAYFALGDAERGRSSIRDYYVALGDRAADAMAQRVNTTAGEIRKAVASFEAIGADEVILHPGLADPDEVSRLADAVL